MNLLCIHDSCEEERVGGSEYCAEHQHVDLSTEELDRMVRAASIPNLAGLMRQAVSSGSITPTKGYAPA